MLVSILSLPISFIYSSLLIYLVNRYADNNGEFNFKFLFLILVGFSLYGYTASSWSTFLNCNEMTFTGSMYDTVQLLLFVTIIYLLVLNLSVLNEPFNTIFPDSKNYYAIWFFVTLTCIIVVLNIVVNNEKKVCSDTISELKKKYDTVQECLNKTDSTDLECRALINNDEHVRESSTELLDSSEDMIDNDQSKINNDK